MSASAGESTGMYQNQWNVATPDNGGGGGMYLYNNNNNGTDATYAGANTAIVPIPVGPPSFPHPSFRMAYDEIRRMIAAGAVSETSWLPMVVSLMQVASSVKIMTGLQKKATVTDLAMRLLNEIPMETPQDKQAFLKFATPTVNIAIDQLILAEKGEFDFKQAVKQTYLAFVSQYNSDQVFTKAYSEIRTYIDGKPFQPRDLILLLPMMMSTVHRFGNKSSVEKKNLVMALCYKLVDEVPIKDKREKVALTALVQMTLPVTIDGFFDAAAGKWDFGQIKASCFPCLGGGSKKKKKSVASIANNV
jgi:hypothetical protein